MEGDLRLRGGTTAREGRLEIYHNDQWGTVCDRGFGITDANVVCRQLGLPGALEAKDAAFFGQGGGPTHLDEVVCLGSETRLTDCNSAGWGIEDCSHSEDVGVICEPRKAHHGFLFCI